jgi:hypothetical protein
MRDNRVRAGEPTFYSGLDDLSAASVPEKIAWLRARFDKVVSRPLGEVRRIGADNQAIWDLNLGVVTIICSAIEALGSFYSPGVRDETAFDNFVIAFMNPIYQQQSPSGRRTYAKILYAQFRCGLAHGLSIEGHEVTTRPGTYVVDEKGYVSIDLWTLFDDMEGARTRYLTQVESDNDTRDRFIRRFDELFVKPYR